MIEFQLCPTARAFLHSGIPNSKLLYSVFLYSDIPYSAFLGGAAVSPGYSVFQMLFRIPGIP
ncbi:hypothetical protein SAMN05444272_1402 [Roseibium suaedae]|uniref:Uncharacterized protein n=1 Tax=Roseibium suaedae TaxID=735517 RepID=A0A1M7D8F0_9HYPH|nr:hypothetical protein SAMN05444272_1402 [Roseibium suaedae]